MPSSDKPSDASFSSPKVTSTPKGKTDPHGEFVKERSPSDDSGYWTSPSTTMLQQQQQRSAKLLAAHDGTAIVAQAAVPDDGSTHRDYGIRQQSKGASALLERLEQKIKASTVKAREESKNAEHRKKISSVDVPMKAFPDSSITKEVSKDKLATKKQESRIPVFVRKGDKQGSPQSRASSSDSEATRCEVSDNKMSPSGSDAMRHHSDSSCSPNARQSPTQSMRRSPSNNSLEQDPKTDLTLALHSTEEPDGGQVPLLTPKPPEGGISPRKGLVRRNSLRRRHSSGRDAVETAQPITESVQSVDVPEIKAEDQRPNERVPSPTHVEYDPFYDGVPGEVFETASAEGKPAHESENSKSELEEERSRPSDREPRKPSERRASSVGAIMSRLGSANTAEKPPVTKPAAPTSGIVADKPPIGRSSREPSAERRRESSIERSRQYARRRTKSEQGTPSDSEDTSIPNFYRERRKLSGGSSSAGDSSRNPGSDSDRESSGEAAYGVVRKLAKDEAARRGRDITPKKKPFSHKR